MPRRKVFFSFHYKTDVMRVAQIKNIGAIEHNKLVSENEWEKVQKKGQQAIKKWIDDNMKNRSCVVVLVGEKTAQSKWVQYEIKKAWNEGKGLLGIYIHRINCPRNGKCWKGDNPFEQFYFKNGTKLSSIINCYAPDFFNAYNEIRKNIVDWIEEAIKIRKHIPKSQTISLIRRTSLLESLFNSL